MWYLCKEKKIKDMQVVEVQLYLRTDWLPESEDISVSRVWILGDLDNNDGTNRK